MADNVTKLHGRAEAAVEKYGDCLFSMCSVMLRNRDDAKDAVQECFLKYIQKAPEFNDAEHEKAWLLRVAANQCRDMLRSRKRRSFFSLDEIADEAVSEDDAQVLTLLMTLNEKYRIVMHLFYVEEYSADEIAEMLEITRSAVKKRLQRGREMLRELYEKEGRG